MGRLERLAGAARSTKLPPLDSWQPSIHRDLELRISRDGAWHYLGSPIVRQSLVRLLSRVLIKEGDEFFLVSPTEKLRIEVEDAPFLAVELERLGHGEAQRLIFRTNVDDVIVAGKEHPLHVDEDPVSGEPAPYIKVREGLWALVSRSVYYELAELVQPAPPPGKHRWGVVSEGHFFGLGSIDEPDCA
ncbi:MAG: DUF1285 domain-containing protein [Arenicellales bacterium]